MRRLIKQQLGSDKPTVTTDFEVRCDRCGVTFPIETKRCMYCGERPGHRPMFARQIALDPLGDIELSNEPIESFESIEPIEPEGPLRRFGAPFDEEATEKPRRSIFRLFGNLSWVILFALLTLYRACTG